MAVASAGPYASLHLAQTDNHASTPPLSFFYRPDALPVANQQRQSTEEHKVGFSRTTEVIVYCTSERPTSKSEAVT